MRIVNAMATMAAALWLAAVCGAQAASAAPPALPGAAPTPAVLPPQPQSPAGGAGGAPAQLNGDSLKASQEPAAAPLPETGGNQYYSYQRAPQFEGAYYVMPFDSSEPILVSESFLSLVSNQQTLSGERQLRMLRGYPALIETTYMREMSRNYPDSRQTFDTAFELQLIGSSGGPNAVVGQDDQAGPYLRVNMLTEDGQEIEFSVSRAAVERILADPNLSDADKMQALQSFPFRLPESIRARFSSLSAEALHQAIADAALAAGPQDALGRQEFLRMHDAYRQAGIKVSPGPAGTPPAPPELGQKPARPPREIAQAAPRPAASRDESASRPAPPAPGPAAAPSAPAPAAVRSFALTHVIALGIVILGLGVFAYAFFSKRG